MSALSPTVLTGFAAVCVWLIVRIINRRERWAKWTLAAVIGVPALYPLSFGPACWLVRVRNDKPSLTTVAHIYRPIILWSAAPGKVNAVVGWYSGPPPAYVTSRLEKVSELHSMDGRLFDTKMLYWLARCLEHEK